MYLPGTLTSLVTSNECSCPDRSSGVHVPICGVLKKSDLSIPVSYTHLDVYKRQAEVVPESVSTWPVEIMGAPEALPRITVELLMAAFPSG